MKKYLNKIILIAFSIVCFSCDTTGDTTEEYELITTDLKSVDVIVTPIEGLEPEFIIGQNAVIPSLFSWHNQSVSLNFYLETARDLSEISELAFYASVQEENGYNYESFDGYKALINTIEGENIPFSGNIEFTFDALEVAALFEDKFQNTTKGDKSRTIDYPLLEGDLFTLTWVIKFTDGTTFDSSQKVAPRNSHAIKTSQIQIAPPIWEGSFPYEIVSISSDISGYTDSTFYLGATGILNISEVAPGEYLFEDDGAPAFFFSFAIRYSPVALTYDYDSGFTDITTRTNGDPSYSNWSITVIDAKTIEIHWAYNYPVFGDRFSANARVTRSDNYDWPTNLSGDLN